MSSEKDIRRDFSAAIEEHLQELHLSDTLNDVIGKAVAHRKIGECFAELGNYDKALKHQRQHLALAQSVGNDLEEQRAWATIGRTFLFRNETDQSRESLQKAEDAFKRGMRIIDERLDGKVSHSELSVMRARLYLNLGFVYDGMKDPQRCSDFIRRSIFIAERNQLHEDLYRAMFNLGSIHFREGLHSNAMRCLEKAKDCAHKMQEKFSESECHHSIGKVLLALGDFVAAKRALKKAYKMGSQHQSERESVLKNLKLAIKGCHLEEALAETSENDVQGIMGMSEQLGDLCCKVACYGKALDHYLTQLTCAKSLMKPACELAVIHVSLAATYSDLKQHQKAVEHYRQELILRKGNPKEECETWLNIAVSLEETGSTLEEIEDCYQSALDRAKQAHLPTLQLRVLKQLLMVQHKLGSVSAANTEAKIKDLSDSQRVSDESEADEDQDEEPNSEPLEESDLELTSSEEEEDNLDEYSKSVPGRRRAKQWNRRNEKGETMLHRACIEGNLKQAQCLVDKGHPLNPRDYCGWTPLHEACNHDHFDIVQLLLDRGANVNDPGGPLCEGITPLHDALSCGNFKVARLLIEKGASVSAKNAKGHTPFETLNEWLRNYGKHLDQETIQKCKDVKNLLKKASSGWASTPQRPQPSRDFQDSELFDAEQSQTLETAKTSVYNTPNYNMKSGRSRVPSSNATPGEKPSSSSRESDTELEDLIATPMQSYTPFEDDLTVGEDDHLNQEEVDEDEENTEALFTSAECEQRSVSGREEYQRAMQALGGTKSRFLAYSLSDSTTVPPPKTDASCRPAMVPEEEYIEDDWLDDDMGIAQPKKKRRTSESLEAGRRDDDTSAAGSMVHPSFSVPPSAARRGANSRNLSLKRGRSRQVKMTQLSGMTVLSSRRASSPLQQLAKEQNNSRVNESDCTLQTSAQVFTQSVAQTLPPPIRVRVRVQDNTFLIPVPHSNAETLTVGWLADQAAQRYYQACGLQPRISLQKEGALLAPQDLILHVLHSNEEVLADVRSWDLPPLLDRYQKACQSQSVAENKLLSKVCALQDSTPCFSISHLSLRPQCLAPLLRSLKLQTCLKELHLSGNRLNDELMGELFAAAATMPVLHLLDVSSNHITGEGLKQACSTIENYDKQPAFPNLEEVNLSFNPLGDNMSQPLSSLVASCPLLTTLKLQGCALSTRFLQQHHSMLAGALSGSGHLKSICLSNNRLGSAGIGLLLKMLPKHSVTHLQLSGTCKEPEGQAVIELLSSYLSQEGCSLTHLSLAGNGLSDSDICTLVRSLPLCHSLVSLDLSANPSVTATGLELLLTFLRDGNSVLQSLDLTGCQVSGPWSSISLDSLSSSIQDLRLCSQRLNKLDRKSLAHSLRMDSVSVVSHQMTLEKLANETKGYENGPLEEMMDKNADVDISLCKKCKEIVMKLQKTVQPGERRDQLIQDIHKVCDKMSFVKSVCKSLIKKSLDYIVKALNGENAPQTICQKLKFCKKEAWDDY
ncbi:TONSL protein, partial [Polypterus senegalus]|nr:TONSL protein [Polypterus senegalus]